MSSRPIERWNQLRDSNSGDGVLEIPSLNTGVESGYGQVRFAIGPVGQPRLLVPCGPGLNLGSGSSNGRLALTITRLLVAEKNVLFIDLMCLDRSLDSVFAEMAEEIVHRVAQGESPSGAVAGTIADFRSLLSDAEQKEIPGNQILGLIGELVVLRKLAAASASAVDAWTGPFDQRHDFRRKERAVEVKASSRADATSVSISSIEQLAEPAGGSLILVHVKVERADAGALSVASLVSEILSLGAEKSSMDRALAAMGCNDPVAPEWNRIRFGLEAIDTYRVKNGFPRIVSGQFPGEKLPEGVQAVSYVIDLLVAKPFLLSEAEAEAELKEMMS
jgi:hypothetical protein